jgi:hypothetical protein
MADGKRRQFVGCSSFCFGLSGLPPVAKLQGKPAVICLLVKLDTTQAAFTVIGSMEDNTALLSG